ncbi:hypothetical protein QJS10_CPB04g00427 [Acorus calamus]|uniref:Uncharacterized protein n=1 Tax=Acorus calamus TaxID=4465 RepID=A0AAV9F2U4_ACOCL|nr:hypothetical protein QJS10_CPB04g00427 [Acorus calamus]
MGQRQYRGQADNRLMEVPMLFHCQPCFYSFLLPSMLSPVSTELALLLQKVLLSVCLVYSIFHLLSFLLHECGFYCIQFQLNLLIVVFFLFFNYGSL